MYIGIHIYPKTEYSITSYFYLLCKRKDMEYMYMRKSEIRNHNYTTEKSVVKYMWPSII